MIYSVEEDGTSDTRCWYVGSSREFLYVIHCIDVLILRCMNIRLASYQPCLICVARKNVAKLTIFERKSF